MKVPKPKVVKDPKYLAYVRTLQCWAFMRGEGRHCNYAFGRSGPDGTRLTEPNHLRTRSDDSCVIPLCPGHHRTNTVSWHNGEETFCGHHRTSKEDLIREAEALYTQWRDHVVG